MHLPPEVVNMIATRAPAEARGVSKLWKSASSSFLFKGLYIRENFNKKMLFLLRRADEVGTIFNDDGTLSSTETFYFVYPAGTLSHQLGHTINLGLLANISKLICPRLRSIFELFSKNVSYSLPNGPSFTCMDYYLRPCVGWFNFIDHHDYRFKGEVEDLRTLMHLEKGLTSGNLRYQGPKTKEALPLHFGEKNFSDQGQVLYCIRFFTLPRPAFYEALANTLQSHYGIRIIIRLITTSNAKGYSIAQDDIIKSKFLPTKSYLGDLVEVMENKAENDGNDVLVILFEDWTYESDDDEQMDEQSDDDEQSDNECDNNSDRSDD